MSGLRYRLAAVLLLLAGPAYADCHPIADEIAEANAAGLHPTVLDAAARARALAFINAQPPETAYDWDVMLLTPMRDGDGILATGHRGAVCSRAKLESKDFRQLVSAALGDMA
jgi:hypothetical protein